MRYRDVTLAINGQRNPNTEFKSNPVYQAIGLKIHKNLIIDLTGLQSEDIVSPPR